MSWPWVFILFLLASTSRVEDSAPSSRYQELDCRMFGTQFAGRPQPADCRKWDVEGCGPLWRETPKLPRLGDNGVKVGWAQTLDETTSITFSFEKEWLGAPERLYEWYGPAGTTCKRIFEVLDNSEKKGFLKKFRNDINPHTLRAWDEYDHVLRIQPHNLLPLERSDEAAGWGMSQFIEYDSGPWEIKADTFYYSVEEMEEAVTKLLPYVDVPGDFPAERRIQIHVVAPIAPEIFHGNDGLKQGLRLIQLYFSDYMFLRLIFPQGPEGELCKARNGETFKCDVLTDKNNDVIDEGAALRIDLDDKEKIVGIRDTGSYEDASGADGLERVGFEIRKSASFEHGVLTARAIADAIADMSPDGTTRVGLKEKRDIWSVLEFATTYRMKLKDRGLCSDPRAWQNTLRLLAGKVGGEGLLSKLTGFLRLLLCSDWAQMVGSLPSNNAESRVGLLAVFESIVRAPNQDDVVRRFLSGASKYAFALSELF